MENLLEIGGHSKSTLARNFQSLTPRPPPPLFRSCSFYVYPPPPPTFPPQRTFAVVS